MEQPQRPYLDICAFWTLYNGQLSSWLCWLAWGWCRSQRRKIHWRTGIGSGAFFVRVPLFGNFRSDSSTCLFDLGDFVYGNTCRCVNPHSFLFCCQWTDVLTFLGPCEAVLPLNKSARRCSTDVVSTFFKTMNWCTSPVNGSMKMGMLDYALPGSTFPPETLSTMVSNASFLCLPGQLLSC